MDAQICGTIPAMFRIIPLFFVILVGLLPIVSASGTTVLLLKDGGKLEGELLNPDEINRKLYQIKTTEGTEISLDPRLVERIQSREREALIEYNRKAPLTPNTVENHLYWAKWCNEQQLPVQAKVHWQQILELDPDHVDARRIFGYTKTATGGWESQRDKRESQGYIQYQGQWKTQYEIEVAKMFEDRKKEIDHWQRTIGNLCRRLPQSEAELLAIRDPAAVIPIRDALRTALRENNPRKRIVLLRTLVQIPDSRALEFVAGWSIRPDEPSEEIRKMCVGELQRRINSQPEIRNIIISTYRSALRSKNVDKAIINIAAEVLGNIGGHEAVPELIDVLVVQKTEIFQPPQQPYSFGSGKSGFSQPGKPVPITTMESNQAVLSALTALTGVNFGFNQAAWRQWNRQPLRSPSLNLRRI